MSRISETTNSGIVRIADDQFKIIVNLLNKIAGNTPEAAHAAAASTMSRPTRPVPHVPQHAPTIVAPKVVALTPAATPAAPGYVAPPPVAPAPAAIGTPPQK